MAGVVLDHLFVLCARDAPEAEALRELGLEEGSRNRHPGQGTANRRFFFRNAMLELLWVEDEGEARSPVAAPLRLWERWSGRGEPGVSPFGVCTRPAGADGQPPFRAHAYRPPYLPAPLAVDIAEGAPLVEPLWFHLAFSRAPADAPPGEREPLVHPVGLERITGVTVWGPPPPHSEAARALMRANVVDVRGAAAQLLEVELDGGGRGETADLQPALPLRLRW